MDVLPTYFTGILALLLLTSFVKVLTTLNIMRYGIGLEGAGFGVVTISISFALSLLIMSPQVGQMGGLDALFKQSTFSTGSPLEKNFRPFLEKNVHPEIKGRLMALAERVQANAAEHEDQKGEKGEGAAKGAKPDEFSVLISAFLVSELQEAFQLGLIFLVPFLVIDLVVVNILMSLGISQMSQNVVAVPLKIFLFFAIDGWALVAEKLINGYL